MRLGILALASLLLGLLLLTFSTFAAHTAALQSFHLAAALRQSAGASRPAHARAARG